MDVGFDRYVWVGYFYCRLFVEIGFLNIYICFVRLSFNVLDGWIFMVWEVNEFCLSFFSKWKI